MTSNKTIYRYNYQESFPSILDVYKEPQNEEPLCEHILNRNGKCGIVDNEGMPICPFDYDQIIPVPYSIGQFLLIKGGQQGLFDVYSNKGIVVPCEMDSIHRPDFKPEPFFFRKDGKWGWYWNGDETLYRCYQTPIYDEIFYMTEDEWFGLSDDDEEFFEARIGNEMHYILEWTCK